MSNITDKKCHNHPLRQVIGKCRQCNRFICDICVPYGKNNSICVECNIFAKRIKTVVLMVLVATMGAYLYFELIPKYGWFKYECDRVKVLKQCNDYIIKDQSRSCLIMSDEFFEKCGDYDQLHRYRNAAARRLSEWKIALESANKLIDAYPDNAELRWMRGGTLEEKGDLRLAVNDYEQSLALMPRAIQTPFQLASLYQRLGEPCSGVSPLEQYSYYHPDQSENANRLLNKLYGDPRCLIMHGSGKAKIKISQDGKPIISQGLINGVHTGRFMIDTGATVVVLSSTFAEKIGIHFQEWPTGLVQTANGMAVGYFGYVDQVALQGVESRHIKTVVTKNLEGVDGLLGLSFLSRFKINMDAEKGYISLSQKN